MATNTLLAYRDRLEEGVIPKMRRADIAVDLYGRGFHCSQAVLAAFAEELGLNADDYVSITSYTHHPFYTTFALEVPDNWRMDQMYNVPMEEMMAIIDNALANGYTLAWGADVSEMCFTRKGLGVVPEEENAAAGLRI